MMNRGLLVRAGETIIQTASVADCVTNPVRLMAKQERKGENVRRITFAIIVAAGLFIAADCKRDSETASKSAAQTTPDKASPSEASSSDHGHEHDANGGHDGEGQAGDDQGGHAHDEVDLGEVDIGDLSVSLAQGHGKVVAGQECHLVVKLPYKDSGATVVRAWLGTQDRTLSMVGKGTYAPSHDDYDIHAMAPEPLPADVMWWIEIEKPDGTTLLGSATPLME
jgi:hypothetical protein